MAIDPSQFLTHDEAVLVEAALLTTQEKFTARVALYSLRTLKQIAKETGIAIHQLTAESVLVWIAQDIANQKQAGQADIDVEFVQFFTRLVMSSLKPLKQIAEHTGTALDMLSVQHVISWFEQTSRARPR
jgi:hypothetical protein